MIPNNKRTLKQQALEKIDKESNMHMLYLFLTNSSAG